MSSSVDFAQVLSELQTITRDSFSKTFFNANLRKEFSLKEINVSQQKEILNFAINEKSKNKNNISFPGLCYKFFKENIIEGIGEEDLHKLNLFDRILLSLALRSLSSETLVISYEDKEEDKPIRKTQKFSIEKLIEDFNKNLTNVVANNEVKVKSNHSEAEFTVGLKLPLISEEIEVDDYINSSEVDFSGTSSSAIGDMFVLELIKYIDFIQVNNLLVKFRDLKLEEKLKVINNLPSHVANPVINKINLIKDTLLEPLVLKWKNNSGEDVYFDVSINSEWFLNY